MKNMDNKNSRSTALEAFAESIRGLSEENITKALCYISELKAEYTQESSQNPRHQD